MAAESRDLFLLIRVHQQLCALRLEHVEETMRPQPVRAIAGAPSFVRGIAVIRGAAVPVVDASLALGGSSSQSTRFVAVNAGERRVALAVDQVLGVRAIEQSQLAALPGLLSHAPAEVVSALGTLDAELLMVLRTGRLVPNALWAAIETASAR